ncbi:MAG: MarR family transcriptional regulator [Oscillospiraceae bacterium]|nr:MarR family transcriptional regulator [Oscillospiraceae bacterium]
MSGIDFLASIAELYDRSMAPVSSSFGLTATELSILLFLANNPGYDTARGIVEKRHLAKSHVSVSLRALEEGGLIRKEHRNGDNRTVHLVLLPASEDMIREGLQAQAEFLSTVTCGFSTEELSRFRSEIGRMNENVLAALQNNRKGKHSK